MLRAEAVEVGLTAMSDGVGVPKREYTELVTVAARPQGAEPSGALGPYEVTIIFRHPIQAAGSDERLPSADEQEGDSGIGISDKLVVRIPTTDQEPYLEVEIRPNSKDRIGKAKATVVATTYGHALSIVHNHVGAYISRLAFESDAPIAILQSDVREVATGGENRHIIARGATHRIVSMPTELRVAQPFFRAAYGVYREGLNATSPYYALLCFYRISEGCRAYLQTCGAVAAKRGIAIPAGVPLLEDLDGISADFPAWIGWKCSRVAHQLARTYRVPVAHGLFADSTLHAPDQVDQETTYWSAAPVARQVARKLLLQCSQHRTALGTEPRPELGE